MTRQEKIDFCVSAVWLLEGDHIPPDYFEKLADEELDREIEWFNYLAEK